MDDADSPLSDLSSEDFIEEAEVKHEDRSASADPYQDVDNPRPSKRQRTGASSYQHRDSIIEVAPPAADTFSDVSSDTSGSLPGSPSHPGEDDGAYEQITICRWDGCEMGDMGNMDKLVDHLHEDHIGSKQKKYSCEWLDCSRKGIPHASGYALRAHMRSHTREKPFYCTLPECDRSFTRSDALAKHMRTVHETEALRPSDPVPKHHSSNPSNKLQRLKLVFNKAGELRSDKSTPVSPSHAHPLSAVTNSHTDSDFEPGVPVIGSTFMAHYLHGRTGIPVLTEDERALAPDELFRLLRRELHWAQTESEDLKAELIALEGRRREEWEAKELVLENMLELEAVRMERKGYIDRLGQESEKVKQGLAEDTKVMKSLEFDGLKEEPWWRKEFTRRPKREPVDIGVEPPEEQLDGSAEREEPQSREVDMVGDGA
ncbi:hypothetical protein M501DRAFT_998763 [Patellaria atrata CBS 101060]|uniref:C2H2-type domain-containing protein n=1 Tax=Patellaria atrata CBS 101060 TaxID=1346257 RepID=A0A9P4SGF4_9PEZI|nr:hypothetical protein M501DRAFT_998763 [Patellaria atrata CBS 101060]